MNHNAFDIQGSAPLAVLAMLGTILALAGFALGVVVFALLRKPAFVRLIVKLAACWVILYGAALLGLSLFSKEATLEVGLGRKYFCEIDCHLAYSVEKVETSQTLGPAEQPVSASGTFYVVTLRTWFDPSTISPHRGNGPLTPNERAVVAIDEQGKTYPASTAGMNALHASQALAAALRQALHPGESYETTLVFDLPSEARNPRLWLYDPAPDYRLLIGHESSFLHKKVYFSLSPKPQVSGVID